MPTGKVIEFVCYINGQPIYSGTKTGASVALTNALVKAQSEGRAEPPIKVTQRVVDYDAHPNDPAAVTETEVAL